MEVAYATGEIVVGDGGEAGLATCALDRHPALTPRNEKKMWLHGLVECPCQHPAAPSEQSLEDRPCMFSPSGLHACMRVSLQEVTVSIEEDPAWLSAYGRKRDTHGHALYSAIVTLTLGVLGR